VPPATPGHGTPPAATPASPASPATPGTRSLGEDFALPAGQRYYEDYQPGSVYEYGYATVTEAEIIDFATRFDPQPIHTDPAYAAAGPFGGIIASGWHTAGIAMRLIADHYLSRVASLASPGVDELRWPAPVRPGDRLRLRMTVLDARTSRSKPDRGIVRTRAELLNSGGQPVLSLTAMNILLRRPGG
jgi:acyl dehydratase